MHSNGFKRFKTILHPSLTVKYIDSVQEDDGKLYLVTEPIRPISSDYSQLPADALLYGLFRIASTISFLNQSGFIHANIQPNALFEAVQSGEWKLFGLDFTSPAADFVRSMYM